MKGLAVAVVLAAGLASSPRMVAADVTATELIARMLSVREGSTGESLRARLVVRTPSGERDRVTQLRIKIRRDGARTQRLYQVIWPKALSGHALYLDAAADGAITGFTFAPPDAVTPLADELREGAFFESDLTIDDLVAEFWHWPEQTVAGEVVLEGERCAILESRPRADDDGAIRPVVRSWISLTRLMPWRIEAVDPAGRVSKRFTFQRPMQRDGAWTPRIMLVQIPGANRETVFEIVRGEIDVEIPPEAFTLKSIRALAAPAGTESSARESPR